MQHIISSFYGTASPELRQKLSSLGLLIMRAGLSIGMWTHGWPKLVNYAERAPKFVDPFGVGPEATMALAIMAELLGSIALTVGLFSRLSASALAFSMAIAAYYFGHELAYIYMLAYIGLIFTGPGRYSIDQFIYKRYVA
ncbi:DoxX family protein [Endozoicomonas lisbonensis]|uniref:Oxidoreductase n=1 Tax=Endozoicomonas lisbonensis TaxID=3120522 RepID=A0ABV2SEW3_9GAMM